MEGGLLDEKNEAEVVERRKRLKNNPELMDVFSMFWMVLSIESPDGEVLYKDHFTHFLFLLQSAFLGSRNVSQEEAQSVGEREFIHNVGYYGEFCQFAFFDVMSECVECWSETNNSRFYPAFAWTLFLAVMNVDEQIPRFIEQNRIKRIPCGQDAELLMSSKYFSDKTLRARMLKLVKWAKDNMHLDTAAKRRLQARRSAKSFGSEDSQHLFDMFTIHSHRLDLEAAGRAARSQGRISPTIRSKAELHRTLSFARSYSMASVDERLDSRDSHDDDCININITADFSPNMKVVAKQPGPLNVFKRSLSSLAAIESGSKDASASPHARSNLKDYSSSDDESVRVKTTPEVEFYSTEHNTSAPPSHKHHNLRVQPKKKREILVQESASVARKLKLDPSLSQLEEHERTEFFSHQSLTHSSVCTTERAGGGDHEDEDGGRSVCSSLSRQSSRLSAMSRQNSSSRVLSRQSSGAGMVGSPITLSLSRQPSRSALSRSSSALSSMQLGGASTDGMEGDVMLLKTCDSNEAPGAIVKQEEKYLQVRQRPKRGNEEHEQEHEQEQEEEQQRYSAVERDKLQKHYQPLRVENVIPNSGNKIDGTRRNGESGRGDDTVDDTNNTIAGSYTTSSRMSVAPVIRSNNGSSPTSRSSKRGNDGGVVCSKGGDDEKITMNSNRVGGRARSYDSDDGADADADDAGAGAGAGGDDDTSTRRRKVRMRGNELASRGDGSGGGQHGRAGEDDHEDCEEGEGRHVYHDVQSNRRWDGQDGAASSNHRKDGVGGNSEHSARKHDDQSLRGGVSSSYQASASAGGGGGNPYHDLEYLTAELSLGPSLHPGSLSKYNHHLASEQDPCHNDQEDTTDLPENMDVLMPRQSQKNKVCVTVNITPKMAIAKEVLEQKLLRRKILQDKRYVKETRINSSLIKKRGQTPMQRKVAAQHTVSDAPGGAGKYALPVGPGARTNEHTDIDCITKMIASNAKLKRDLRKHEYGLIAVDAGMQSSGRRTTALSDVDDCPTLSSPESVHRVGNSIASAAHSLHSHTALEHARADDDSNNNTAKVLDLYNMKKGLIRCTYLNLSNGHNLPDFIYISKQEENSMAERISAGSAQVTEWDRFLIHFVAIIDSHIERVIKNSDNHTTLKALMSQLLNLQSACSKEQKFRRLCVEFGVLSIGDHIDELHILGEIYRMREQLIKKVMIETAAILQPQSSSKKEEKTYKHGSGLSTGSVVGRSGAEKFPTIIDDSSSIETTTDSTVGSKSMTARKAIKSRAKWVQKLFVTAQSNNIESISGSVPSSGVSSSFLDVGSCVSASSRRVRGEFECFDQTDNQSRMSDVTGATEMKTNPITNGSVSIACNTQPAILSNTRSQSANTARSTKNMSMMPPPSQHRQPLRQDYDSYHPLQLDSSMMQTRTLCGAGRSTLSRPHTSASTSALNTLSFYKENVHDCNDSIYHHNDSPYVPWVPKGGMKMMISDKTDVLDGWKDRRDVAGFVETTRSRSVLRRTSVIKDSFEAFTKYSA